jgi:1-aminocyclopropane-1-carboxylate deaminase/D-cysteine desulfhydrase-like pyridoxal-dependent ACC family enzyme
MSELPLYTRFPQLAAESRHLRIGDFPTPITSAALPGNASGAPILVKRDDLCAGRYGGNKVRKLEFLLADARARGARRLITAGAMGSHHALATTLHGRAHGFAVTVVLFPQLLTSHVRTVLLLDQALGAELRFTPSMRRVPFALLQARLAHRRESVCVIPPGGSSVVGTLGYVNAALELAAQIEAGEAPRPARIYVAAGTLGTAAGLALGLAVAGLDVPIVAVRITSSVVTNRHVLRRLVSGTRRLLARGGEALPPVDAALRLVQLRHDQLGDGYGRATAAGAAAARHFAALGLTLDATYTAKAAAALLADLDAQGGAGAGTHAGPPLFWHTLSASEPLDLLDQVSGDDLPAPFAAYLRG